MDHQDLLGTLVPLAQVVSRASQVHRDRKVLLVALDNQDSRVSSVRTVLLVSQEYVVTTAHLAVLDNRVPLAIVETKELQDLRVLKDPVVRSVSLARVDSEVCLELLVTLAIQGRKDHEVTMVFRARLVV